MPGQVLGIGWTGLGTILAVLTAVASAAYVFGQAREEASEQSDTIRGNQEELEELSGNVSRLNGAIRGLSRAFTTATEELEANRRDIRHQNRIIHDQFLEDGETCGNPGCAYCHPEKRVSEDVDIDVPDGDINIEDPKGRRWETDQD